jgi:predicted  nucleic acid-binding Zn-ribbon protein
MEWPSSARPAFDNLSKQLRSKVEPRVLEIYDSLCARNQKPFAAVVDGACTACRFPLAAGSLQALEAGWEIPLCRGCGRFLHAPNADLLIDAVNARPQTPSAARPPQP